MDSYFTSHFVSHLSFKATDYYLFIYLFLIYLIFVTRNSETLALVDFPSNVSDDFF